MVWDPSSPFDTRTAASNVTVCMAVRHNLQAKHYTAGFEETKQYQYLPHVTTILIALSHTSIILAILHTMVCVYNVETSTNLLSLHQISRTNK